MMGMAAEAIACKRGPSIMASVAIDHAMLERCMGSHSDSIARAEAEMAEKKKLVATT
jgi:hypothetical protein